MQLARDCDLTGLIENRDRIDVTDDEDNGPLHLIIMSNSPIKHKICAIQILLHKGAQPWMRNLNRETAEDLAITQGWTREQRMKAFAMMSGRTMHLDFSSLIIK